MIHPVTLKLFPLIFLAAVLNPTPPSCRAEPSSSDKQRVASQIYYGSEVSDNNAPIARLYIETVNGEGGTCTGIVLNNRTILTAAHCLEGNLALIYVVAGGRHVAYGVSYDIHPQYSPLFVNSFYFSPSQYDLGYIKLNRKLPKSVKPFKMAKRAPKIGDPLVIFGYGYNKYGSIGSLRIGIMQYTGMDGKNFSAIRPYGGSNACAGDSGGPAITFKKKKLYLVGLNSFGDCEAGINTFTSVLTSSAKKFIKVAKRNR